MKKGLPWTRTELQDAVEGRGDWAADVLPFWVDWSQAAGDLRDAVPED